MPSDTDVSTATGQPAPRNAEADRICVVMNPGSGKQGDPGLDDRVRNFVARHPDRLVLWELDPGTGPQRLAERAVEEGFGIVVAAGGDGTIAGVAEGLHGHDVRMGVLPMGTFNYFARGLDIPLDIDLALDLLLHGCAAPVTVAEVNGKLFLNNASLGVYPAILAKRETVYKRWGRSRLAAYWSVILTLAGFRRARTVAVTIDGVTRRRRSPLIFVAHSAYQLEEFGLDGADLIRRGRFAVFLAPDVGRWGLLKFAVLLLGRSMARHRDFELLNGVEIDIEAGGRRLVARDGERERMASPIRIRRRAEALHVILPASRPQTRNPTQPEAA